MIEEREELILSQNSNNETPVLRKAHFLKPTSNPSDQPLPKPPSSFSLSSKFNINHLQKKVFFKGRPKPQKNWHLWVGNLMQTHEFTWKKVGIFDAIRATTYNFMWDNELILGLAQNWCSETNSFVFTWGECSITLEDVMILGGFSVLGECVNNPFENREIEDIENELLSVFSGDRKNSRNKINQYEWMNYFMDFGGEFEHIAFLVLWLSRYVFSTDHYCEISPFVFPIAIALARGTRIALAPAVLSAIYRDLSLLKDRIVSFVNPFNESNLILWAPFQLVQLWAWERFSTLCPKPIALFDGEPRLARWQNLPRLKNKMVMMGLESLGESFLWRPYALCVENWKLPEFYDDEERMVLIDSEVGEELLSFAKCLRACELVGLDCIQQYLPQRLGKQFGFDQDIPGSISRVNDSAELAWSTYDISLDGAKLYLSPRLFKGGATVQYFDWFRTELCLEYSTTLDFKRQKILRSSAREARFIPFTISGVVVEDSSKCAPTCLAPSHNVALGLCSDHSVGSSSVRELTRFIPSAISDVVVEDSSKCAPTCLAPSHNVVLGLCSDHSVGSSSVRESTRFIPSAISDVVVEDSSKCAPTCLAPSHNVVLGLCSDRIVASSSVRELTRFIPSANSDVVVEDSSKCAPTCLAPSHNVVLGLHSNHSVGRSSVRELGGFVPSTISDVFVENNSKCTPTLAPSSNVLALCSVHSVEKMHIKATPSWDKKSHVDNYEEMPSPTPNNELTITSSHDLYGLTAPNCDATSGCVISSCYVPVPSSFVLNTEERHIEAAPCDMRATPNRIYGENSECMPSQCPKEVQTTSNSFEQTADLNNLHNVGQMPNETITSCDNADNRLRTPTPSNDHADDSGHCPSQSLIKERKNDPSQILNEIVEDNSKGALPCLPSSLNVVEGSHLIDNVGEMCIETIPSSDKNNSLNISHNVGNHEIVPSSSTQIDIEKVVEGMDFLMEQVETYKTRCVSMSSDRSADCVAVMHTETFPSCDNKAVSPRESHDIVNEVSPTETHDVVNEVSTSLCNQKVDNEVPSSTNTRTAEIDKRKKTHEHTNCNKTEVATDEHGKEAKSVNMKLVSSSFDYPVIIEDDNEDDKENNDLIPFDISGLESRISKLERIVLKKQAAKLQSKAKRKAHVRTKTRL